MKSKIINNRLTKNLLSIYNDDPDSDLKQIFMDNSVIIAEEIINKISYAIDNKLKKIAIAKISNPVKCKDIMVEEDTFLRALKTNMKILIGVGEYEACAKAKRYIEILQSK